MSVRERIIDVWYGRIEDAPRFPDLAYWQAQDDETKFDAAWNMVLEAHAIKGEDLSESRLQRSIASFQRRDGRKQDLADVEKLRIAEVREKEK